MPEAYQEALEFLYSFTNYEVQSGYVYSPDRFDLGRVHRLLDLLGNPHRSFRSVHIAGTKGKGSTAAMVAAVLQQAGHRTGLYTSPHLHTFRERIQIDGELVPEASVVAGVERLRAVVSRVPEITTFELITALAFDTFARTEVQWAVVEVGMGGRLDATNVITPQVSVITPISYDHMTYLGDTLGEIAGEKAGIIKPGVPVVTAPQPREAADVFAQVAAERSAPLTIVGRDWQWESVNSSSEGQRFSAWPSRQAGRRATYSLPLLGSHQLVNATTALATVEQIRHQGTEVQDHAIRSGLAGVRWPGRLEVLGTAPWTIVDGAHNGDSMEKLASALGKLFPHEKAILIWGTSSGKDVDGMLDALLPIADHILVTQAHHPRATNATTLVERVRARGREACSVPMEGALKHALSIATERDLVCGTGSLFVVADLREAWFRRSHLPPPPSDGEPGLVTSGSHDNGNMV